MAGVLEIRRWEIQSAPSRRARRPVRGLATEKVSKKSGLLNSTVLFGVACRMINRRPRIVTANVATLDGRIAVSGSVPAWRDERWVPIERAGFEIVNVAALHGASITLEGSNSFAAREAGSADVPPPAAADQLHQDFLPAHLVDRVERWMAVIDSRGRVAWTETEDGGAHLLVLVCRSTPSGYLAFLRERGIPYLLAGDEHLELDLALRRLGSTFDIHVIVSTAGGLLNGALLRVGLVDEIDLQILPIVLGVADAPAIFDGYGIGGRPIRLTLRHQESRADGSLFLRLDVEKGPA